MEVDWDALGVQACFSYKYLNGKIVALPLKPPMMLCNVSGVELREGGEPDAKQKYRVEFAKRGMTTEFASLAWRRFLADSNEFKRDPFA